jgi:hypothetical protein
MNGASRTAARQGHFAEKGFGRPHVIRITMLQIFFDLGKPTQTKKTDARPSRRRRNCIPSHPAQDLARRYSFQVQSCLQIRIRWIIIQGMVAMQPTAKGHILMIFKKLCHL